jgi:two-component system chemotaxis response regulator CheY
MAEKTTHAKYFGDPEGLDTRGLPVRVLVVDDEEITRKLIIQVLKSVGYEIVGEAENGSIAIDLFRQQKPDLVTLDVRMPTMDGYSTLIQLKRIDENANVVMLTNENDRDTVTKILGAGAINYIVKPLKRQVLLEKLREARITLAQAEGKKES